MAANATTQKVWGVATIAVLVFGSLTGCGVHQDGGASGQAHLSREELLSRPALEAVVPRYDAMLAEMRTALSVEFPGTWEMSHPESGGPTGDGVGTVMAGFSISPIWRLDETVAGSADDKKRALAAVSPIAVRYGFCEPVVFLDRADELQAVADDALGATFNFGSIVDTTVSYNTGSHLLQADLDALRATASSNPTKEH